MKRRPREIHNDDLLRDGQRLRVSMFAMDSALRSASAHLPRVHDGTGDSGLAMHRPGFRVTDARLSDALQRAYDAYEHELTTAWRRTSCRLLSRPQAIPLHDIETAYRLYAEEISQVWKTQR
ncbi:MAG: hypothetical protein WAK55_00810 [Xanthobacteraceae bacterium]